MANTDRMGRFFKAGTGGNLDLLLQDAILPERCARVHLEQIFAKSPGGRNEASGVECEGMAPGTEPRVFRAHYEAD
jgi:hypothetical protein